MEITAFTKSAQVAPRKVRIVAEQVRKQSIDDALSTLSFLKKRGASVLEKTLRSAVSNALSRNVSKDALFIKNIEVSEGSAYKRFHPSTRGRIHPYKKRTSHIRIILSDQSSKQKVQNAKLKVKSSIKERKSGEAGSRSAGEEKNGTKS